jgi:hypothetical protein
MSTYTPAPGSVAARVIEFVRKQPRGWVPAMQIKCELGIGDKIAAALAPALRHGLLESQTAVGRTYYRLPSPKRATHRFQLNPVWPPGFVSKWDAVAREAANAS